MKISYLPTFVKKFDALEAGLQKEILEKIELFKSISNHKRLNVHKLHGRFKNRYSFSVNYKYRILFAHLSKEEVVLMTVGDHSIYD